MDHEKVMINSYEIKFPFKPYPLQKAFMNQVLSCVKNKKNGLLESPTGTGKTLSLLCSSLAWLDLRNKTQSSDIESYYSEIDPNADDLKKPSTSSPPSSSAGSSLSSGYSSGEAYLDDEGLVCIYPKKTSSDEKNGKKEKKRGPSSWFRETPKILYASRTHAQLSQACREMKRTNYNHMNGVVIGGRDNLCINAEVQKQDSAAAKNHCCRAYVGAKKCEFHTNYEKRVQTTPDFTKNPILDMEDLVRLGNQHKICPYYASRLLMQRADVVFAPYNYILDPTTRKSIGIEIENNVIIIDEGHNIEKICEDSVSCELRSDVLEHLRVEIENLIRFINTNAGDSSCETEEALEALMAISTRDLLTLSKIVEGLQEEVEKAVQIDDRSHPQEWIFEVLDRIKLNFHSKKTIASAIDDVQTYILIKSLTSNSAFSFSGNLQRFMDFTTILFPEEYDDEKSWKEFKKEFQQKYRILSAFVEEEEQPRTFNKKFRGSDSTKGRSTGKKKWVLNLWCLSASVALKSMQKLGAHSIIITSGTLAPLNSFQVELELPFPITLQNLHIVKPDQVAVYIVRSSWNNVTFDSSYTNRENMLHVRSLGQAVSHFCKSVPGGILLFFSSYAVMNNMLEHWKKTDSEWRIHSAISSQKSIFIEPQNKDAFNECIQRFKDRVDAPRSKGAIFMGVCRGKLSEGLDMANQYCRAVLMVGLPFPAVRDRRVLIKKQYLKEMNNPELNPTNWYTLQMKRALNQAIGRVVRHKDDYGIVALLDSRFDRHIDGLSRWMRDYVKKDVREYKDIINDVELFFKRNQIKYPLNDENKEVEKVVPKNGLIPLEDGSSVKSEKVYSSNELDTYKYNGRAVKREANCEQL
ncbi:regulator of telomere elongation helicase 1 [Brevipalpus obovatus]|uniref:regulator of telomere elongation helicase 1 n=1 Tax=Brevipalpus obovatus TaxID=246614 RepID=UPI003D9EC382